MRVVRGRAVPAVLVLVFAMLAAACASDTSGPPVVETTSQTVDVTNVFAEEQAGSVRMAPAAPGSGLAALQAAVEIRRIRVTVYEVPGGAVLFQKTYDVDPTKTRWTLAFEAPVGATVRLVTELMSVTAGVEKVEYSGQAGPVTITPCTSGCAPIPVRSYPGPVQNLDATSVAVSPAADTIAVNGTTQLTATVAPAGPAYQPVWTSLDTLVARVSAAGLVTGRADGFARVVVAVGQRRDTAHVVVGQATCGAAVLIPGAQVSGRWDATDCILETVLSDRYTLTLGAQATVTTTLSAAIEPKYAGMYVNGQEIVNYVRSTPGDLAVNWFLAPGAYEFRAAGPLASPGTAYTLNATSGAASIGCATNATSGGITLANQALATGDCAFANRFEDRLVMRVEAGRDIVATMAASFGVSVIIRDPGMTAGTFLVRRDGPNGSATATWRAATTGYYQVIFSTMAENATGSYSGTLAVN